MVVLYKAYQLKNDMREKLEREAIINELRALGVHAAFEKMSKRELKSLLAIERVKRE